MKQHLVEQPWLAWYFGVQHGLSLSSARMIGVPTHPALCCWDSKFLLTGLGIWLGGTAPTSTYLEGPVLSTQNITYIHRDITGEGANSLGSAIQHLRAFLKQANISVHENSVSK